MEGENNNVTVGAGEGGGSSGPIIGAIVIIAAVVLGGLYFWGQRAGNEVITDDTNVQTGADDSAAAIEADLNTVDIENLDAGLDAS